MTNLTKLTIKMKAHFKELRSLRFNGKPINELKADEILNLSEEQRKEWNKVSHKISSTEKLLRNECEERGIEFNVWLWR